MITLIRPSDAIAVIIPVLWGLESLSLASIKKRAQFLWTQLRLIILSVFAATFVASIQVMYWLYVTGKPFVYSYAEKGFSWKHPHFFDYTFSYKSGWLLYTPLLFLVFLGLLPFLKHGKNKVAVILFFFVNYYIVAAWDVWWYGGMGGRPMVQSYAVVFFVIATLVELALKKRWLMWFVFPPMLLFSYINLWFTYNAHRLGGLYDPQSMTKEYYWSVIGRLSVPLQKSVLKDTDEFFGGTPRNIHSLYLNDFEADTTANIDNPISGKRSLYFYSGCEYSPVYNVVVSNNNFDWLRASACIKMYGREVENWKMLQYVVRFIKDGEIVKDKMIRVNRLAEEDVVRSIYFDIRKPKETFDSIEIFFWNPGSDVAFKIDDIQLSVFDE